MVIEDAIRAIVREELRAALGEMGVATAEYTSASPPPRTTARTFSRWCRSGRVKGAVRDGSGWRCTVEQWQGARAAGPRRADLGIPKSTTANDVDAMLEAAGLRSTKRATR